jgi:hypothetical protein
MTDLRKAAEMALEVLTLINQDFEKHRATLPIGRQSELCKASLTLRQALAQSEQEPLGGEWVPCVKLPVIVHVRNQRDGETHISTREGITPVLPEDLIMRGVAGEEYPIGRELFERTYTFDVDAVNMSQERVDETAKSEHEPFIYVREDNERPFGGYEHCSEADAGAFPVYTAPMIYTPPPKREWVGLTDEEIIKCFDSVAFGQVEDDLIINKHVNIFRAIHGIEAKLKEKNT